MSIVGSRPLSVLHYERDRAQGNVTRFLLRGGLLAWVILIRAPQKWAIQCMNMNT